MFGHHGWVRSYVRHNSGKWEGINKIPILPLKTLQCGTDGIADGAGRDVTAAIDLS